MIFADPQANAIAHLILRHLYDGDVIDWPIDEDDPQRPIFLALEEQGYVARWDRVWPLHDRYRLTEKGIAAIESVYRPAGSEEFFNELRKANLDPQGRRTYLAARGLDPMLWPLLHDPSTHWSTFSSSGALYHSYVWEDQWTTRRRTRHSAPRRDDRHHHHNPRHDYRPHDVDLDEEMVDPQAVAPMTNDYDVS